MILVYNILLDIKDFNTYNYTIKGLKNYKNSVTGSFTIDKAAGSVTTQPTANSLTYNTQAQALVTAGSGTGDIRYKLDEGEWSASIPTAINAGTYIVSYKVLESANYLESSEGSETVIIDKITPTVVAPTAKTLTYSTEAQDLINLGSTDFGTMQYSLDETNWTTTSPQGTAYGSYTVYYRVVGDSNTYDVAPSSINVSIAEKVVNAPTIELS
jgi:methionine-rich copper-binding protein CopC